MTWFARASSRRERDALLDYWDEVIAQSPATPVPPATVPGELAALVRTVHTADATSPDHPAFEDRLLRSLLARQKEIAPMNATAATAPPLSPPRKPVRTNTPHRRADRSRAFALPAFIIALIVIFIAASAAGIWFATHHQDEPHRMMAPIVATPGADASPDVPMYRANPARTGVMPGPGIDGQPVERWRAEIAGSIHSAPAIVDGILYVGAGDGGVYAFDTATGDEVWQFAGSSPIQSSPAVSDGVVYVGSEDGTLYAIDAATGEERWSTPGARPDVSVVIVGDTLYTGSEDGFLYALDTATGDELWRAPLDEAASRSPAVADGVVYMGSADGVLHTFDAETGEPGWALALDGDGILSTTVVTGGVVYQGTFEGAENYFFALDAATGDELWRYDAESGGGFLPSATDGHTVYTVSNDTNVYALDAATGAERWRFATAGEVSAAPALVDNTLYVGGKDGFLYAIDAESGREIWRFALEGGVDYGPVVIDGVAYVGTEFGYLYAIGGSGTAATPVAAVPSTPAATPVASPAASTGLAEFVWEVGQDNGLSGQPYDVTIAPDGTIWTMADVLHQVDPDGSVIDTWAGSEPYGGALHFDGEGNLYIVDTPNYRVLKFGPDRELLLSWGSKGQGDGQFAQASDLVIDSAGNVYIVDAMLQRIEKFGPDGTFLATISGPGEGEGQLQETARMGIDQDDDLYVPDGSQVEVFAPDGTFLRSFGAGHLGFAVDAAVDDNGVVYISDAQQNQIQVYDPAGNLLGSWGAFGREPGNFIEPDALALDGLGNLYVLDFGNQRIQKFALASPVASPGATPVAAEDMTVALAWQSTGGPDPLLAPTGMAFDPDGNLWVTDTANDRFQLFSPDGEYLETWGEAGDGDGQFDFDRSPPQPGDWAGDIAFAPDGSFYVSSAGNQRVQHFSADREFLHGWGSRGTGDGQFLEPWSIALGPDGNVYVIDDFRNDIQVFDPEGTYLFTFGGDGSEPGQLRDTGALVIDAGGNVWVADYGNHRVQKFTADGTFVMTFGEFGPEEGQFIDPEDLVVDQAGNIYVAERERGRVQAFTPEGDFLMAWSAADGGQGALTTPVGVIVDDNGSVYVTDIDAGTVQKFDVTLPAASPDATPVAAKDSAVALAWQSTGGPDPLLVPNGLAIAPDGNLWVVDSGNNRFQILSSDGDHLETWGEAGDGDGQFTFVRSSGDLGNSWSTFAFAPDGSFYVAEPFNQRIQHFGADRTFLGAWGSRGRDDGQFLNPYGIAIAPDGNVYVIDDDRGDIQVFDPDGTYLFTIGERGSDPGQLSAPGSVAIDADGNVWVADYGNHRVQQFAADGTFVMTFGEFGREEGQFIGPADLAIDQGGNLYVSEPDLGRVQVFTPEGEFLMAWSAADDGEGALTAPVGLAVDADRNVYVADMATSTVQKFRLDPPIDATGEPMPAASPEEGTGAATFLWETVSSAESDEMGWPGPVAVAPDGTIWLTDSEASRFLLYTPDGAYIEAWGTPGQGDGEFNFAVSTDVGDSVGAIAFAPDGSFYVADTGSRRIQHFSIDRKFLGAWGEFGPRDGEFLKPIDVAVDSQGNVFVVDESREVIQKFDATGTHLLTFGGSGSAEGQLDFPSWIAIDASDSIWVADTGNGRIQQFDNHGAFVAAFDGDGALVEPWEVAVDDDGTMYVADFAAGQVVVLDPSGAVIGTWGEAADGPGELHFPIMLALDGRGNVLVVDCLSDVTWEGRLVAYRPQPSGTGEEVAPEGTPVN